jgi:isoleucyl-tRNA synthetase
VVLTLPAEEAAGVEAFREELEEFLILSELVLETGDEPGVQVTRTAHEKCERCWRHREDVGTQAEHPGLCGRCAEAVTGPK